MPSPMPTSLTGTSSSASMARMVPPREVPSSLVSTMPVSCIASWKARAWATAFIPVGASMTSRVSCGASGMARWMTRRTFSSSAMRLLLVCRRPAVSTRTTSARRASAAWMASYTTAPGSAPGWWATTSVPLRSAHTRIWSMAAARKVSAAATSGVRPSSRRRCANLPSVVVLPLPLTPDHDDHAGPGVEAAGPGRGRASSVSISLLSAASASSAVRDALQAHPLAQRRHQLLGHAHAGVGADEDLEEVVVEGVVEVTTQQHGVAHLLAERQRGAVHPPRHAPPPRLAMARADTTSSVIGQGSDRGADGRLAEPDDVALGHRLADSASKRTLITELTPSPSLVTPWSASAAAMVMWLWVTTMNCCVGREPLAAAA